MVSSSIQRLSRRGLLLASMSLLLLMPILILGQGSAHAQVTDPATEVVYALDSARPVTEQCPVGTNSLGPSPSPDGTFGFQLCRPAGFGPMRGIAACRAAGIFFELDYAYSPSADVCAATGFAVPAGTRCSPLFRAFDLVVASTGVPVLFSGCVLPLLTKNAAASTTASLVCIESSTVQDDSAAAGLSLGSQFVGSDGVRYLIGSGPPTCSFNCDGGFDANCDDKIGDFCPVELNVDTVEGVRACLAHLNPAPAPLTVESVPAAAAPQAVPVPTSVLAHTGVEDKIAAVGLVAIAYGAVALAVRRRVLG